MPKLITGKDTEGFVLPNYSGLKDGSQKTQGFSAGISGGVVFSDGTNLQTDPTNFFWDDTSNRLGIGTQSTATALHIAVNTSNAKSGGMIEQAGSGDGSLSFLLTGGTEWIMGVDNSAADNFAIKTGQNMSSGLGIDLTTAGRLGVRASTPTQQLEVSGALCLSGATNIMFGTLNTAPTILGSGSIFLSGGTTNTVGVWLKGYSGSVTQLGSYI